MVVPHLNCCPRRASARAFAFAVQARKPSVSSLPGIRPIKAQSDKSVCKQPICHLML